MKQAGVLICTAVASLAVSAGTASAAAPQAVTGTATNVTVNGATVNGTVSPNHEATTYHFDYGTTTAYGTSTSNQGPLNGNASKSVSATLTGLAPGKTYHFRLVATNASGTATGNDATFTTAATSAVTIKATPRTVTFGKATTITGHVSGNKAGGASVQLEQTPFPFTSPFKPIASGTADQAGNYTFANVRPSLNTRYQVKAKTAPPSTSPFIRVNVRPAVTLRLNDSTPARGQRVRFSGEVTPAQNGKVVRIQRHTRAGWRTIATPTLRATTPTKTGVARSRYSRRIKVRRTYTYRTIFTSGAGAFVRGTSRKHRARVH